MNRGRREGAPPAVELDRSQAGMLLAALAELPFKTVYALIGKLNEQAARHFPAVSEYGVPKPFVLERREWACCLQALGALPYRDVHGLVERIRVHVGPEGG